MRTLIVFTSVFLLLSSCKKEEAFEFRMIEYYYIVQGDTVSSVFMPNAFTPYSDDGVNEAFLPIIDGYIPNSITLEIVSMNGEIMYYSKILNYGWDGTYLGKLAFQGIYLVKLEFTASNGVDLKFENELMLWR